MLFMLHTMTTVSVWCWLLATLMRYVAVYHPQMHMSCWRLGCRSLGGVVLVSALMNCWVPITAVAGNGLCIQVCDTCEQLDVIFISYLFRLSTPVPDYSEGYWG